MEETTILIVDDIDMNVEILNNIISHEGYETMCAMNVRQALELMKEKLPALILSDLSMPDIDGLEFCRILKEDPATRDIPFVFISVLNTSEEKKQAFEAGAVDFIPKPFDPVEVIMRLSNHLNSYRMRQQMAEHNRMMHRLIESQQEQIEREQKNMLLAISKLMQRRNHAESCHLEKVGYNCGLLAQGLQLLSAYEDEINDEFVETIETAAKIHDIGGFVLSKDDFSDGGETKGRSREYIEKCADTASLVLEDICDGQKPGRFLSMAITIAKGHHAHWDGTGYPAWKGKEIPLEVRIASVANDFDHLTAGEIDGEKHPVEESVQIINERGGTSYDPDIVMVFNKIWRQMRRD
ncbi:MAG: response regulator [Firmicutes bacterium]|nr:response regulator [Bacillota bacterium]